MEIRDASHSDLPGILLLIEELFSIEADFEFDKAKAEKALNILLRTPGASVIVACENETILGLCTMQTLISTAEGGPVGLVEDMVISKAYRRKGIGSQLLSALEQRASANGLLRLQLLADKNNLPALDFYVRNKWSSTQLICLRKKDQIS